VDGGNLAEAESGITIILILLASSRLVDAGDLAEAESGIINLVIYRILWMREILQKQNRVLYLILYIMDAGDLADSEAESGITIIILLASSHLVDQRDSAGAESGILDDIELKPWSQNAAKKNLIARIFFSKKTCQGSPRDHHV